MSSDATLRTTVKRTAEEVGLTDAKASGHSRYHGQIHVPVVRRNDSNSAVAAVAAAVPLLTASPMMTRHRPNTP
jgi:hypothetical protein